LFIYISELLGHCVMTKDRDNVPPLASAAGGGGGAAVAAAAAADGAAADGAAADAQKGGESDVVSVSVAETVHNTSDVDAEAMPAAHGMLHAQS